MMIRNTQSIAVYVPVYTYVYVCTYVPMYIHIYVSIRIAFIILFVTGEPVTSLLCYLACACNILYKVACKLDHRDLK